MTMTLGELLSEARATLKAKGIESAALDAELICCRARGCSRAELWAHPEVVAGPDVVSQCRAMVKRRAAREPLAYILGFKEFWSLEFRVTPAVFIPRPETETLVEAVLEHLPEEVEGTVIEVGAGSGCVAVALAKEREALRVVTTDKSLSAISVARDNIRRHGVADRVLCVASDVAKAISTGRPVLGLVSNPPYIPQPFYEKVAEDVRYEPPEALEGGPSGLEIVKRLILEAEDVLPKGAFIALELGPEQIAEVGTILADGPWDHIEFFEDLQGIPRVVIADRS